MIPGIIKEIPYGVSDYARIVRRNYYYIDKTPYLAMLEKAGDYLFLIRPRRFGKSLFVAVMESYYDVLYKDRFEELFKCTWIYEHPTEERGQYLTLVLNFSAVEPELEKLETSFLNHVQMNAVAFVERYRDFFSAYHKLDYYAKNIETSRSASDILSALLTLCKEAGRKVYVIIDEYDNFSNTILSTAGKHAYHTLTHGTGFFRSFFNILKSGTTRTDSPISRLFITGVSPVTMDDVTSGFNIGQNVSLDAIFNRVMGFTEADFMTMLNYYRDAGFIDHEPEAIVEIMNYWYGNYLFSEHSDTGDRLYNPDMVLYFFQEYFKNRSIPDDLIDRNVRIDYGKLKHLIILDKGKTKVTNGNFSKLKEIIEEGGTTTKIVKGFPLEKMIDANNFKSLLFYLGLLTIKGPEKDKLRLEIPNQTIKHLYYDYIEEAYRETNVFAMDLSKYSDLMTDMAYDGQWEPLFNYIAGRMKDSMSLRDLITGEKSIQAFLNVYLGLSDLYIIHTEKEMNKGYADIVMEPFLARYEDIKYSYLIEIKYIKTEGKRKPGKPLILCLKKEAEEQLRNYSLDGKFRKSFEKTTLIKIVLIFSGHELVYLGLPSQNN
ncbi:MAG TPA: AAA family ATPase [Candidatus Deferrimicrobium sp.]|nr:AAA family ATPase [Candidatus Kapabacteria bacterium]HLP58587.1 AAA family ATPase [Candidatus Deferrimicrobium sp.]